MESKHSKVLVQRNRVKHSIIITKTNKKILAPHKNTHNKFLIELISQQRVRQFSKVHLEQWADRVHIVYVNFLLDFIELLFVKRITQLLYVWLKTCVPINAVYCAVFLYELRANGQNFRNLVFYQEISLSFLKFGLF